MLVTLKIIGLLLVLCLALITMLATAPFVAISLAASYVIFLATSSLYEIIKQF